MSFEKKSLDVQNFCWGNMGPYMENSNKNHYVDNVDVSQIVTPTRKQRGQF